MRLASCERLLQAPIDVVWALVSTPKGLDEWMSVESEVDLRPGGIIRWVHDNGWVVAGEVREVVPFRRLVFTYGWETGGFDVPVHSSVVTIELVSIGARTRIVVRHEGLAEEMADQHSLGWAMFLGRLVEVTRRAG